MWTQGSKGTATDWQQRRNSFFKQQRCWATVSLIRQVKDWAVAVSKLAPPHSTDRQHVCCKALLLPIQTEITMMSALLWVAFSAWCIKLHCIPKWNAFGLHWIFKCLAYGLHTSPEKHKLLHTQKTRPSPHMLACTNSQTHMLFIRCALEHPTFSTFTLGYPQGSHHPPNSASHNLLTHKPFFFLLFPGPKFLSAALPGFNRGLGLVRQPVKAVPWLDWRPQPDWP